MIETISTLLVALAGVYGLIGILVALPLVWRGVGKLDPAADGGSLGFRLVILPGTVALWPFLLRLWWRSSREPA